MRYAPAVSEDWSFIRDAMRMRGISPSPMSLLKAPARTVDCVYAPLLMSASRVCDDLSMAAIVRGDEVIMGRDHSQILQDGDHIVFFVSRRRVLRELEKLIQVKMGFFG